MFSAACKGSAQNLKDAGVRTLKPTPRLLRRRSTCLCSAVHSLWLAWLAPLTTLHSLCRAKSGRNPKEEMASGDFCLPGEGMELLQQVCSKQLPPCNLTEEDLLQNPHFSKLLLNLSQYMDESGLSTTLAEKQAEAWKEVRLQKTAWLRSEILQRLIQEMLVDYYVKTQDTNLTPEDKKFHESLEQRLLVTELTRLLDPSQEKEISPLLGLEKSDLLELMPPSEDFVKMRACLQPKIEEQLKKKCFTLLCYHDPSSDSYSETVKATKVWQLAEVLTSEKQEHQEAKKQQKEQTVLLEKQSSTYSQVLLRCLTLLQRLLQEHRLKTQSELDQINAQYLEIKCSAMILKLRMEELQVLSDTYPAEKVEVHRLIRDSLEGAIRLQEQDMEKSRQVLNTYEVLGEEFDKLVKEYTHLKQATENKRWALQEFNKSCH